MGTSPPLGSSSKTPMAAGPRPSGDKEETAMTGTTVCYPNWTPMPLPPHDLVDLEELEKEMKKEWFKASYPGSFLYDETGTIIQPVDSKGLLIVGPETRTRLEDAFIEYKIMWHYEMWISDTRSDFSRGSGELGEGQTGRWLRRLDATLEVDRKTIKQEYMTAVDEERRKRGLSSFHEWVDNFNLNRFALRHHEPASPKPEDDSNNLVAIDYTSEDNTLPEFITEQPLLDSPLHEATIIHQQLHENTPLIFRTEDESIQTYCFGCCVL